MAYLEKVANEGVQTHKLIVSEGSVTTVKRCTDAYGGLQDYSAPSDMWAGGESQDWQDQIKAFFVQSCVSGLPKAVPGQPAGSTPSASSSLTSSPSSSR
jgi:hypothetical protein